MKTIRIAFSLLILGGMLAGFSPRALCEAPALHFLYFKNGTSMRCDSSGKDQETTSGAVSSRAFKFTLMVKST